MFEPILTCTMADIASIEYQRQDVFQPTGKLQDRSKPLFLKGIFSGRNFHNFGF